VGVVIGGVSLLGWSQQLENVTIDWRFRAREPYDPPADFRISLVGIGEYSLKRVGRWEEWTRAVHASVLEALKVRPPAVLAYDFFFSEESRDPASDEAFVRALEEAPFELVTGAVADDTRGDAPLFEGTAIGKTSPIAEVRGDRSGMVRAPDGPVPIPGVAEAAWTGFVNSPPTGVDGVRRKVPLVVEFGGQVYPSLVLQILLRLEGARSGDVEVSLGDQIVIRREGAEARRIPIDENGFLWVNYRSRSAFEAIDYIKLGEALEASAGGADWPEGMPSTAGRIVLVGQMAEGLADFASTPYSPREPLVFVQAAALNTILRADYLRIVPLWQVLLGWLPLVWGTLYFLRNSSVTWSVVVPLFLAAVYVGMACFLFVERSLQWPLFLPVAGFLIVQGAALLDRLVLEMRAKSRIRSLFGTYAPPEVVDAMIESGEDPKLGGQEMEITAFFSDVEAFSTFSEVLGPEPLVRLMNDYLGEMTEVLFRRGGTLDKYIGDAIVGMFGAPAPFPDHAYRACAVTIEMHRRLSELREKWRREGIWPEIVWQMRMRIGLNTGLAVIGNMGSARRFNYTMMGDTVNLAARCESGAKSYGVYAMVTGETRTAARSVKDDLVYRYLDRTVVKGRSQPVEMYEVLGFADELPTETAQCIEVYSEGIEKYLARDWEGAVAAFERSSRIEPFRPGRIPGVHDNPSLVMIGRCNEMKARPPGEDWDGRYVMKTK